MYENQTDSYYSLGYLVILKTGNAFTENNNVS
jgi:hypothetical protein